LILPITQRTIAHTLVRISHQADKFKDSAVEKLTEILDEGQSPPPFLMAHGWFEI